MDRPSLELYRALFFCRRSEELIILHYPENEMRTPMHMSFGQEAIAVGVCAALGSSGQVLSSYRSHAAFLARTRNSDLFFSELFGKMGGTATGKSGSMHLASPGDGFLGASGIVGSGIPVGVGAAFANQQQGNGKIVVVFFGDGALDEGVFWESVNVACLMKLPILLVCEDNGLAVHTSTKARRGYSSATALVGNFECVVKESTSTDVEEIYDLTTTTLREMETRSCPGFLYLRCYRYLEHVGIGTDFADGYRSQSEYEEWKHRDPVSFQRTRLVELGYSEREIQEEERVIERGLLLSIDKARAAKFPSADQLYRGVFHEND